MRPRLEGKKTEDIAEGDEEEDGEEEDGDEIHEGDLVDSPDSFNSE